MRASKAVQVVDVSQILARTLVAAAPSANSAASQAGIEHEDDTGEPSSSGQ